ncbi:MAG: hypothetical protein K9N55_18035 [Phycisphaerae bacterium]|nr:hypothetical protein [Phycisphaerae bacterium]
MKTHKIKLDMKVLWLGLVFTSSLCAQTTFPLTAQDVVEKAIRTLGGRNKLLEVDHSLVQGTLDIKSVDIQGTFKIYSARPNKLYAWFDVNSMGILERGFDGKVYWEKSTASGPRIFTGDELKMNRLLAYFDLLYYDQIYKELQFKKLSQVNDQPCQEIDLIAQDCNPITLSFSKTTGLPIQQEFVIPDVFEPTHVTNTIMAYKEFNGHRIPSLMVQKVRGMETHRIIQSVEFNGKLPEGIFDLPQEIKALLREQAALDANEMMVQSAEN